MSDGIVPSLFRRPAAANWASDGNGRGHLFSAEVNFLHVVHRL